MTLPGGLLVDVQRRLEAFYALEPHAPVTDFVIPQEEAAQYPGGGSRTLVKEDGDEISVGVVFDEATARRLRESDPRVRLDYCGWLEASFVRPRRHADLAREARRFYRLGQREKLARIARM